MLKAKMFTVDHQQWFLLLWLTYILYWDFNLHMSKKMCNVTVLLQEHNILALFTPLKVGSCVPAPIPWSLAPSTTESQIYMLFPVMGRSHIYDLLRETCHRALKKMWIQPSHKCLVYFPEDYFHSSLHSSHDETQLGGRGGYAAGRIKREKLLIGCTG